MVTTQKYWNTWHADSYTRMEFLPAGFSIVPSAYSEAEQQYSDFPMNEDTRLLEHEKDGRYCRMQVGHAQALFMVEYLKPDPWTVLVRITNTRKPREWGFRYQILLSLGFEKAEEEGIMFQDDNGCLIGQRGEYHMAVSFVDEPYMIHQTREYDTLGRRMEQGAMREFRQEEQKSPWATAAFTLAAGNRVYAAVSVANDRRSACEAARDATGYFDKWEEEKRKILSKRPHQTDALHEGMLDAVCDIMAWNDMSNVDKGMEYTAITKSWNKGFGGWFLFFSDSCYQILLTSVAGDREMASKNLEYCLTAAVPGGNFAGMLSQWQNWVDRTQPPCLGYCLLQHYLLTGDKTSLYKAMPSLVRAGEWYLRSRDPEARNLIRLGTSRTGRGSHRRTKFAALNEAAMDNSPMYDEAVYDKEAGLLEQYDIGVSSMLALDMECQSRIADILGDSDLGRRLKERADKIKDCINEVLWNAEEGIYANRNLDGSFGLTSPTSFYPLAAGVADAARVEACISHIFNEQEFFTPCPLSAIDARADAAQDNQYWRGRTWAPGPYWTYVGLRRVGRDEEAYRLAAAAVRHFDRHWKEMRRSYENYNSFTGEGSDSVDSDPFYSWSALFALIWSMEQLSVDPWNGLCFGMLDGSAFEVDHYPVKEGYASVICDGKLTRFLLNGKEVFVSDLKTRFRGFCYEPHFCKVCVNAPHDGFVRFEGIVPVRILLNREETGASNEIRLKAGENVVEIIH